MSPLSKLRASRTKQQDVRSRYQSTGATPLRPFISTSSDAVEAAEPIDPRKDLESALRDLQTHAPNYVNIPRLQLALRNLSQQPGHESIRVAFLGLTTGDKPQHTARELLRLVLADPLKSAESWEAQLKAHDPSKPLIVHIGPPEEQATPISLAASEHVIPEITVPSHIYNDANLEMLVMEADTAAVAQASKSEPHAFDDAILVPAVDTAATTAGHSAPIVTPVHMAVLVGDGVLGAASILSLPISPEGQDTITAVANFKKISADDKAACPSLVITSVESGAHGLDLFRESASNAMKYEALWTEAGVGHINKWLRSNVLSRTEQGTTKQPVRNLIESVLRNAGAALQAAEYRDMKLSVEGGPSPLVVARLNQALAEWAQDAHEELQQQLEIAFVGEAWRQMNWWKLFWRVDDVGMLSSEMVAQRFLPEAEKRLIFLAGRLQEAGITVGGYSGPAVPPSIPVGETSNVATTTTETTVSGETKGTWPAHIPFTRNYLQAETVPALQALAQKLVLQSSTLAGATTALGGMSWLSGFGVYECGAVAALGIALSLRGLQRRWERARDFWEGEVREEGRKAVRATEASIAELLDSVKPEVPEDVAVELEELKEAKSALKRAEEALARLK